MQDFLGASEGRESDCQAGDMGSIPGSGQSPGGGSSKPLQYSSLEIPWTEEPGTAAREGTDLKETCIHLGEHQSGHFRSSLP